MKLSEAARALSFGACRDVPDLIEGITRGIWEDRGLVSASGISVSRPEQRPT